MILCEMQSEAMRQAVIKDTGIFFNWSHEGPDPALYPKGAHSFIIGCYVCDVWVGETARIPLTLEKPQIEAQALRLLELSCKSQKCEHIAKFKQVLQDGPTRKQMMLAARIEKGEDIGYEQTNDKARLHIRQAEKQDDKHKRNTKHNNKARLRFAKHTKKTGKAESDKQPTKRAKKAVRKRVQGHHAHKHSSPGRTVSHVQQNTWVSEQLAKRPRETDANRQRAGRGDGGLPPHRSETTDDACQHTTQGESDTTRRTCRQRQTDAQLPRGDGGHSDPTA